MARNLMRVSQPSQADSHYTHLGPNFQNKNGNAAIKHPTMPNNVLDQPIPIPATIGSAANGKPTAKIDRKNVLAATADADLEVYVSIR
jgi:hypothetical protein